MTISYADRFSKLLLCWKGSLWKTIWKDLVLFLCLYYLINFVYRFVLNDKQKATMQTIQIQFDSYTHQIPLTFLLGFYVGMVVKRWWEQFGFLSWPDSLLYYTSAYLHGHSSEMKAIRKSIARYLILTCVLGWRSISTQVLKRFPTDDHLLKAGLLTKEELQLLKSTKVHQDPHKKWFVPLIWVQSIFVKCLEQKKLSHTNELLLLLGELDSFRKGFQQLFIYDWISIPLVYTQVATIAVYGYFSLCLIARQYPTRLSQSSDSETVDVYIPLFTVLQFLFYVGWLKVGEDLISPFGEDDEDFELNYLLDRHNEIAFLIADKLHGQMPSIYHNSLSGLPDCPHLLHTAGSARIPMHLPKRHVSVRGISTGDRHILDDSKPEASESEYTTDSEYWVDDADDRRGCSHCQLSSVLCFKSSSDEVAQQLP